MLGKIFKGKRKLPLHELVSEYSYTQYRKNLFLRRYIILLIFGILFMFWLNGQFQHGQKWTYYFALNDRGQLITLEDNTVPQPFSRDDIVAYATQTAYELFSITPQTYRRNLNNLFTTGIVYKKYINKTNLALEQSGLLKRVKGGWYYTVEKLGDPLVQSKVMNINGIPSYVWQVSFPDFVLYGRKSGEQSKISADLEIIVAKTPFMISPNRLSVVRIFIKNLKDVGGKYGY